MKKLTEADLEAGFDRLGLRMDELRREIAIYRKENAILARALEWYANRKNWTKGDWSVPSVVISPDYGDPGGKARRALERARRVKV